MHIVIVFGLPKMPAEFYRSALIIEAQWQYFMPRLLYLVAD
jgi:hypothetical protein